MTNETKSNMFEEKENNLNNDSIRFTESLHDLTIVKGNDAVFECKVAGCSSPKCFWYKDGKALNHNEKIKIDTQKGWHRLEIVSVDYSDHGLYNFVCTNNSSTITAKANLYVAKETNEVLYTAIKNNIPIIKHLSDVRIHSGGTIHLEALINSEVNTSYVWYKNGNKLNDDRVKVNYKNNRVSLVIDEAETGDTGIYCVVARTKYDIASSYANVEVFDSWKMYDIKNVCVNKNSLNCEDDDTFIQDHLPEEIEANENDDIKLTCVAKMEYDTKIEWFKDKKVLNSNSSFEDYGHSYIGLRIKKASRNDTGNYTIVLTDEKTGRADGSNCFVNVNASPIKCPPVINVKHSLQSAIASYGSKIVFDCTFDHDDFKYFYVVWYVGHYRIERSNSCFSVICKDGHFLLYIKKLEPDMAGEVVCELRRAYSHKKIVTVNSTVAHLTVVPQEVLEYETQNLKYSRGRVYRGSAILECDAINYNASNTSKSNGYSHNGTDIFQNITYCRLDDGYYYLYATSGDDTSSGRVCVHHKHDDKVNTNIVIIEWSQDKTLSVWYKIEYCENNDYFGIGLSSTPSFELECPPVEKMMQFRISKVKPLGECFEYCVSIAPTLELKDKPIKNHVLKPMELFEKEYTKTGEVIGCGAFGSVTLVRDDTEQYLAAKIVKTRTQKKRDTALREYEMMKKLRHPKLVELIDAYIAKDAFVFVMDYLWGGELFDRIVNEEHIKEVDVVPYVRQICEALQYLHANKIAHLDLKPENIICLNPNSGQVKIIDFGLARVLVEGNITRAIYGTRDYIAPEVLNFESLTLLCDMWSLGVVTYMLLSGVMPFAGETWPERSANIIMANYNYDETAFSEISDLAKDFIDQLLVLEANKRMSAEVALKHKWIVEGPPKGIRAGHMKRARENLKSYLANYRARWQRAGNVMIAALRLRANANSHHSAAQCVT